jgi:uncharacterized membrane protein
MMMGGGILVVVALVVLAIFLMRSRDAGSLFGRPEPDRPDAQAVLAARFARGEISEEEFEQRRRVLEHRPS